MELRVHLKVCEGCGCLWYRAHLDTAVYCCQCNQRLKDFPTAATRRRPGRPKKTILPTVFAVASVSEGAMRGRRMDPARRWTWARATHRHEVSVGGAR